MYTTRGRGGGGAEGYMLKKTKQLLETTNAIQYFWVSATHKVEENLPPPLLLSRKKIIEQ